MRYWWVNHNQTWRAEIGGGYLWLPRTEDGGKRSRFYDNMRLVSRGDLIVSYARQKVSYAGVATDEFLPSPRPEFGAAGLAWADEGWMVPVAWEAMPSPFKPLTILPQLGPLLPKKYGPLTVTGGGSQKAYLSEINAEAFELLSTAGALPSPPNLANYAPRFDELEDKLSAAAEAEIAADAGLDATEKQQLVQARRGQGLYRSRVATIETSCRLTGVSTPTLLVASHIKPWRSCASSTERLDGYNGLMLTPSIDRLFDRGLLGFEDNGSLLLSSRLGSDDRRRLRLHECEAPRPFRDQQRVYLDHHRRSILLP